MNKLLEVINTTKTTNGIVLWWLGGSSWVLKSRETVIYVDLFTGPAPTNTITKLTKVTPDLVDPDMIMRVDVVLSTHEHIDHCHRESLMPIYRNTKAVFAGAYSSARLFEEWGIDESRMVRLKPFQEFNIPDVNIRATPSKDCADEDAVGFLIQTQGVTLFDSADSLYFPGFEEIGSMAQIDIALLNFFRDPPDLDMTTTMTPAEVVQAAIDLNAKIVIPKHWDIWEELKGDPFEVAELLKGSRIECKILEPGEAFRFEKKIT